MELRSHLPALARRPRPTAATVVPRWTALLAAAGLAAVLAVGARAADATLRTSAGRTLSGTLAFTPEGVEIRPASGDPARVPVEELVELSVTEPARGSGSVPGTVGPVNGATNAPGANPVGTAPGTPAGWNLKAIGAATPGTFTDDGGAWTVTGFGAGLRGNADSGTLVERRMEVAGQVSAILEGFEGKHPESMAGVILRDNLGDSAAYAFLGQRTGMGICLQYRQIASGMTMRLTNLAVPFPTALRLQRVGGSVVGEVSTNGLDWLTLGRVNVNLGQSVRAGTMVTSGADDAPVTARFRAPSLGSAGMGYQPAAGYPRVVLRGGSVLIAPVESADESVLRLGGALRGTTVSVLNLARIEFLALPPDAAARLEPDRPGVLLTDGDFLEGTLRQMATNSVTVSSLLFGFRRYAAGSEVAALQAGGVESDDAPFRVVLQGGSELRARRVTTGTNELRVESPLLGALVLPGDQIRSLRRSGRER